MGSCFSSESSNSSASPTVKVIFVNGKLCEYMSPCFICNSNKLFYDSLIPPLHPAQQLQSGQLYFVLPLTRMHYCLMASDMAALAVKASTTHSYNFQLRDLCQANCELFNIVPEISAVEMGLSSERSLPSELFNRDLC
uniref:Uncharacterized protein n=1 Tax=Nelumbo nucifera TaxID=4432 RepID=A0A822XP23_NELNU|nr:TPA_asm: hypothetical protein HUJ06_022414 [Nelumbo nucifera]